MVILLLFAFGHIQGRTESFSSAQNLKFLADSKISHHLPILPVPGKPLPPPPNQNVKLSVNQYPGVFPIPHYPGPPKHPGHPPNQYAKISIN